MSEVLDLLKINATNGKENFCELSEKELKAIKELAKKENKEKKILHQRIDKAIGMIGLIIRDIKENNVPPKIQDLDEILSTLQREEYKE